MKKIIKNVIRIGIVVVLCFAAYKQLEKNKAKIEADAKLSEQRNDVIPVITGQVKREKVDNSFELVGSFAPYKQIALMSEVSGKARGVDIKNGSVVRTGQIVVSLDNDLLRIQKSTAERNLSKAQNDFMRLNNLLGEGGVTQQQVEEAQLAVDNIESQIKSLNKQISMTYVRTDRKSVV